MIPSRLKTSRPGQNIKTERGYRGIEDAQKTTKTVSFEGKKKRQEKKIIMTRKII